MVTFEELPPSAQKSYKLTNVVRKVSLCIGYGLMLILFIAALEDGVLMAVATALFGGSLIHGIIHAEFIYKKLISNLGLLIGGFVSLVVVLLASYAGWICSIIDTILLIKKKPLIYKSENEEFLKNEKAQAEIYEIQLLSVLNSLTGSSADKVAQLSIMLQNGTLSVEEYNYLISKFPDVKVSTVDMD